MALDADCYNGLEKQSKEQAVQVLQKWSRSLRVNKVSNNCPFLKSLSIIPEGGKKQEREAVRERALIWWERQLKPTKSVNISYKTLNIPVSSCCHCCVILLLDEEFPGEILKGKLKRSV